MAELQWGQGTEREQTPGGHVPGRNAWTGTVDEAPDLRVELQEVHELGDPGTTHTVVTRKISSVVNFALVEAATTLALIVTSSLNSPVLYRLKEAP